MRITYIDQYFKTPAMVGGTRGFEMMRRLVQRGHCVTAVTTDRSCDAAAGWRVSVEEGIEVHWIGVPYSNTMGYMDRLKSFVRFAISAGRRGSKIPADVVFATSTPLTIALPAVYTKRRSLIPMVFEVRDLWPEVPIAIGALRNPVTIALARRLERFAYRHADRVVALSPGMRDGVAKTGYPGDKIRVIPNSSDLELFDVPPEVGVAWRKEHPQIGGRPMILYAGTVGRINGVDWMARLAKAVHAIDRSICFVAVGMGNEWEFVQRTAADLGVLDRNFFMLPGVAKQAMPAVLSAATLCTSLIIDNDALWHNSANKFFDALAAARPIAVNHRGWQADLIEEHGAGLVLPVAAVGEAARLIVSRAKDRQWVESAGAAARRLAVQRFDRGQLAAELGEVLHSAVQSARDGGSCSSE